MCTSIRSSLVMLVSLSFLAGCPGTTPGEATVPSSLRSVTATGAVAGGKGKLRLIFDNPISGDVKVALKSSSAAVADVPAEVVAPKGSATADFDYDAKVVGTVVIYATLGDDTQSATVTVVDKIRLTAANLYGAALEVGASTSLGLSLNIDPPSAVTVNLSSDNAAVVTTQATVIIAPFANPQIYGDNSNRGTVNAVAEGATTLHAKLDDSSFDMPVQVVAKAQLTEVSVYPGRVEKGGTVSMNVYVNALVTQPTVVTVTSSAPAVVASTTVTVPAGASYGSARLPVLAAGATTLKSTLGTVSRDAAVLSVEAPAMTTIQLDPLTVGVNGQLVVNFDVTASKTHAVTVTSSDPTVVAIPAQVSLLASQSTIYVPLVVLKAGTVQLTIVSGDQTLIVSGIATVTVTSPPFSAYLQNLSVGAVGNIQLYNAGTGTLAITVSDPTVLQAPTTQVISSNGLVPVKGLKAGTAHVKLTLNGASQTVDVLVVEKPTLNFEVRVSLAVGEISTRSVSINAIPLAGTTITFTSSNPAVVAAPGPIAFKGDDLLYRSVTLEGLTAGTSIITATMGAAKRSMVVYVGNQTAPYPTLSQLSLDGDRLQVGAVTVGSAQLGATALNEVPMAVTFSTPNIVEVPGGVSAIAVGEYTTTFPVRALAVGTTEITITRDGVAQSRTVTVVAMPTFTLSVTGTLKVGETDLGYASSDCVLATEVTLPLVSDAPAKATVTTATVTFRPASYSGSTVAFGIKGVAAGTANIKLGSGAGPLSQPVIVAP